MQNQCTLSLRGLRRLTVSPCTNAFVWLFAQAQTNMLTCRATRRSRSGLVKVACVPAWQTACRYFLVVSIFGARHFRTLDWVRVVGLCQTDFACARRACILNAGWAIACLCISSDMCTSALFTAPD